MIKADDARKQSVETTNQDLGRGKRGDESVRQCDVSCGQSYITSEARHVRRVGFEPTRSKTPELEAGPLDLSGNGVVGDASDASAGKGLHPSGE